MLKKFYGSLALLATFLERIINATKSDDTTDDIQLYFSPQNIKNEMSFKPFRRIEKV